MSEHWERKAIDSQAAEAYIQQMRTPCESNLWTVEECRAHDGLYFGYEQELAYWDDVTREAITWCTVCDRVFHQRDLEPCGPADAACRDCRAAWAIMMQDDESEDSHVSE